MLHICMNVFLSYCSFFFFCGFVSCKMSKLIIFGGWIRCSFFEFKYFLFQLHRKHSYLLFKTNLIPMLINFCNCLVKSVKSSIFFRECYKFKLKSQHKFTKMRLIHLTTQLTLKHFHFNYFNTEQREAINFHG